MAIRLNSAGDWNLCANVLREYKYLNYYISGFLKIPICSDDNKIVAG